MGVDAPLGNSIEQKFANVKPLMRGEILPVYHFAENFQGKTVRELLSSNFGRELFVK